MRQSKFILQNNIHPKSQWTGKCHRKNKKNRWSVPLQPWSQHHGLSMKSHKERRRWERLNLKLRHILHPARQIPGIVFVLAKKKKKIRLAWNFCRVHSHPRISNTALPLQEKAAVTLLPAPSRAPFVGLSSASGWRNLQQLVVTTSFFLHVQKWLLECRSNDKLNVWP